MKNSKEAAGIFLILTIIMIIIVFGLVKKEENSEIAVAEEGSFAVLLDRAEMQLETVRVWDRPLDFSLLVNDRIFVKENKYVVQNYLAEEIRQSPYSSRMKTYLMGVLLNKNKIVFPDTYEVLTAEQYIFYKVGRNLLPKKMEYLDVKERIWFDFLFTFWGKALILLSTLLLFSMVLLTAVLVGRFLSPVKIAPAAFLYELADHLPKKWGDDLRQNISDMRIEYFGALKENKIFKARCIVFYYYMGLSWTTVRWIARMVKELIGFIPKAS